MQVLIIEDEPLAAKRLRTLLQTINAEIEVVESLDSVDESVIWLQNNQHPELLFMDIQLADGLCFDILERVTVKSPIIFTTAFDEYAIRAFKFNSIDYLLKPISPEELAAAIVRYRDRKAPKKPLLDWSVLQQALQVMQQQHRYKSRFVVKRGTHLRSVEISEVAYFLSEHKTVWLKTTDGQRYAIDFTLEQLAECLEPTKFFRINRKCIVHIQSVKNITVYAASRLKIILPFLESEEDGIVSRERVQDFKIWLDK